MSSEDAVPYRFIGTAERTAQELDYVDSLEEHLQSSALTDTERMMSFPLYAPRQDLARFLGRYEIFKRVLGIHGSVIECGVAFGAGVLGWAQMSAILEPTNYQRRVIGFDTFTGFPGLSENDPGAALKEARPGGFAIDSYTEVMRCAALLDANRPLGHIPKVELVRGDANETIPHYVTENPHLVVSLLYLDFDIYEPTKTAIEHFVPRMPKGAIIAFDELNHPTWPGETLAALEMFNLNELRLERIPSVPMISFAQIGS